MFAYGIDAEAALDCAHGRVNACIGPLRSRRPRPLPPVSFTNPFTTADRSQDRKPPKRRVGDTRLPPLRR
jgi:hypothetical protein